MGKRYVLPQNSWGSEEPVTIELPDNWDVEYPESSIDRLPALSRAELCEKFSTASGTPPIETLAHGRGQTAILFDDLTRATPIRPVAEILLDRLLSAGIRKTDIRFICALGCHGAMNREDFEKKLGPEIVSEYYVFNHNPYRNCVYVGETGSGIKAYINAELMACDLKIGIGGFVPHPLNAYGGGGKIVMPGAAGIDTIRETHSAAFAKNKAAGINPTSGSGNLENKAFRREIEDVVRLSKFDFKIDALINTRKEIVDLIMGDPIAEYYEAAKRAEGLYAAHAESDKDVVVVNANSKGSEAAIAMLTAMSLLGKNGGDIVLVNSSRQGQATHYLTGPFGRTIGGELWGGIGARPAAVKRLIVFSDYPDRTGTSTFCDPDQQIWTDSWGKVLLTLSDRGPGTKAAVLADGTIQNLI